jgi:type 1 fimbriae regulatory protein FimB/type 1 fimbriae regulatory protein FimE
MTGDEIRAFRRMISDYKECPYVFVSEMGGPLTPSGVAKILTRAAKSAGITIKVHPHMLRHSCGYALANAGRDLRAIQAWLGHADIHHTVRYTALAEGRLKGLFPD